MASRSLKHEWISYVNICLQIRIMLSENQQFMYNLRKVNSCKIKYGNISLAILYQICVPKKKRYLVSRLILRCCSGEGCEMCDATLLAVTCPYIPFPLFRYRLYLFYLDVSIYVCLLLLYTLLKTMSVCTGRKGVP